LLDFDRRESYLQSKWVMHKARLKPKSELWSISTRQNKLKNLSTKNRKDVCMTQG